MQLGVFTGALQYSVFKGSNLIQQDILATTNKPWVAYKYDGGLKGLSTSRARGSCGATSPTTGRTIASAAR